MTYAQIAHDVILFLLVWLVIATPMAFLVAHNLESTDDE